MESLLTARGREIILTTSMSPPLHPDLIGIYAAEALRRER